MGVNAHGHESTTGPRQSGVPVGCVQPDPRQPDAQLTSPAPVGQHPGAPPTGPYPVGPSYRPASPAPRGTLEV